MVLVVAVVVVVATADLISGSQVATEGSEARKEVEGG
jgi:hypothetical protein